VREAQVAVTRAVSKAAPLLAAKAAQPPPTPAAKAPVDDNGPDAPRATPVAASTVVKEPAKAVEPPPKAVEPPPKAVEPPPKAVEPPKAAEPVKEPPPVDKPVDKPVADGFPYRPVAFGAFGLAGVSLITTIAFSAYAAKENQPTCNKPNPMTSCPDVYKGNVAPAALFGVVTGLAAATGALLLVLDWRAKKRGGPTVTLSPTLDGGFAAFASGEF
jgi:hypothetical protein